MATILLAKAIAGANAFWGAVISMAAGAVDSYVLGSLQKQNFEGNRMNDLRIQTSSDGAQINKVWGTARVSGNIIWGTDFVEHKEKKKQGKGGRSKVTTYTYSTSFAIGICEGPIKKIKRIWADGNLWKDLSSYNFNSDGIIELDGESGKFSICKVYQGTETQVCDDIAPSILNKKVPAYRGLSYIMFKDLYVDDFGRRIPSFTFEVARDDESVSIEKIIKDVCKSCYLDREIDTTYLANEIVNGYVTTASCGREIIEDIQKVFKIDIVEHGEKLRFISRDGSMFSKKLWTLKLDDYGAYESERPNEPYQITRAEERELPCSVTLNFCNYDKEFQNGTVVAERINTKSSNELSISTNLIISEKLAYRLAESILWGEWEERNSYDLELSAQYGAILPGDILYMLLADGRKIYATVLQTNYGKPGINKIKAVSKNPVAHINIDRPVDENEVKKIPIYIADFVYKCITLSIPGYGVIFATAIAGNWTEENKNYKFDRFVLYKSEDNGLTWDYVNDINVESCIGYCKNTLQPCFNHCIFDEANTIDVVLKSKTKELDSRPAQDIINSTRYNLCMIGEEILQFKHAVLIEKNTYRISGLLRGRFGTENKIATHKENEVFILLDETSLILKEVYNQEIYKQYLFRIGPLSHPLNSAAFKEFKFAVDASSYKPYAVCHVKGVRSSNNDLKISWIRRSRTDYTWKPYVDNELGEDVEKYEIDILDGENVKRTIYTTECNAIYKQVDQIQDGLSGKIKIRIYQISSLVGRGIKKEVILL